MSFNVGDICYIVTPCHSYSQFEDNMENYPVGYAESIKVLQARVTAAVGVPIVRNGNTRMEYQIEAVDQYRHKYAVQASATGPSFKRVWYEYSLFATPEAAEAERQRQLEKHLKEVEAEFNEQLNEIRSLIKSS